MTSIFDGPAGALAAKVMARANRDAESEAVERLSPAPSDAVLVLGYGPGVGVSLLARELTTGVVVGVDPSSAMFRAATRANRSNIRSGKVTLHLASAAAIPSADALFDSAVAVNTLQLCDPLERCAKEMARVMKPGALLVSLTHDWAVRRHADTVAAWIGLVRGKLELAGFADIQDFRGRAESGRIVGLTARRG